MEQARPHFIRQNVDISIVTFYYNLCHVVCYIIVVQASPQPIPTLVHTLVLMYIPQFKVMISVHPKIYI